MIVANVLLLIIAAIYALLWREARASRDRVERLPHDPPSHVRRVPPPECDR
jgi:hypothetical protein